jgi:flagellar biosynthesis protein FlhA
MPGKQMAIDATSTPASSTRPRPAPPRRDLPEADFFGAMDGASKFVRGDAVAGIIITLINISAASPSA